MKKILVISTVLCIGIGLTTMGRSQEPIDVGSLPFSAAVQAGPTLYLSGQIPIRPDGTVVRESVGAETRQTMDNIERTLSENGYTFDDVVSVIVYLKDMGDYAEMNKAYAEYFKNGFPARACVGGLQIAFDARLEISCIAYKEVDE
ncbi:MAG: RidA family protein [Candidatus Hydrogenedentes bacterium]|nr:RidA family protein [Candidatus Hydrogenedentota bacterium]